MESNLSSSTTSRPSGIPRLSRLPVPRGGATTTLRSTPSREKLLADPGVSYPRLRHAPSADGPGLSSSTNSRAVFSSSTNNRRVSSSSFPKKEAPRDDTVFKKPLIRPSSSHQQQSRPPSRQLERLEEYQDADNLSYAPHLDDSAQDDAITPGPRRSRPSLSERTIETLSQMPPSPSPRRRKSSFYSTQSPMRPPSGAGSAMGSRPGSSLGDYTNRSTFGSRPSSPIKPQASNPLFSKSTSAATARSVSSTISKPGNSTLGTPVRSRESLRPASQAGQRPTSSIKLSSGSKSMSVRGPRSRPSLNNAFTQSISQSHTIESPRPEVATPKMRLKMAKRPSPATKPAEDQSLLQPSTPSETRKTSSSSAAFREQIAKAKAARKAVDKTAENDALRATAANSAFSGFDFDLPSDPLEQTTIAEGNKGLLRRRIAAARTDGSLNISAFGMKAIPDEVLNMYDLENIDTNNGAWYESVDLTKFIAADNELESIDPNVFPDVDPEAFDEASHGSQFGGLELLDLHGNLLRALPTGLGRLQRLTILNISRNQLTMDAFEVIQEIAGLKELRLAYNNLNGSLPPALARLANIEILDLSGNDITTISDSIAELKHLRILNMSNNKIKKSPLDVLQALPLAELFLTSNGLTGTLFSASAQRLPSLKTLDVSNNELSSLAASEALYLPCLKELNVSFNRIQVMPDLSDSTQLQSFWAEDNQISIMPPGLTSLHQLSTLDLSGNDLRTLDEGIGMLENLSILKIEKNPLRDRRLLTMTTEELKRNLCSRIQVEQTQEEDSMTESYHSAQEEDYQKVDTESSGWAVQSGGVLDRSKTGLQNLDDGNIEGLVQQHDVRTVNLRGNDLSSIPQALSSLTATLVNLDLSHNSIERDMYLQAPLSLSHLVDLNLNTNRIRSLASLMTHLSAPSLQKLDVSNNRITALPILRSRFPKLSMVLAQDNGISELTVEVAEGLNVLDVSNNEISHLPPKLGLLGTEIVGKDGLRTLGVSGNTFRVPRYTIVEKGTEAVLAWLRDRIPDNADD